MNAHGWVICTVQLTLVTEVSKLKVNISNSMKYECTWLGHLYSAVDPGHRGLCQLEVNKSVMNFWLGQSFAQRFRGNFVDSFPF